MKHLPALPLLPLATCLGLIAATGARADEPNPYYIGASQAFTHDSNVLRLPEGFETSDTLSTTSLLAGFDQPISRQRLYANGTFRHNRYSNQSALNYNGYALTGGLDWATIGHLSGKLAVALNRTLAQYGSPDAPQLTSLNIETSRQASATAALGVVTKLTLEGGVTHRSLDYSAPEWLYREYKQNAANIGLSYAPSDLLKLGIGGRETRGEFPFPNNVDPDTPNRFRRHDLDLTGTWVATGASTLNGRLSFGRTKYDTSAGRDFSGATGSIQWLWKPTGKLNFNTLLLRDTGAETGYTSFAIAGVPQAGDSSRLTTLLRVQGDYAMTAKIQLTASASNTHRSLVSTFLIIPQSGTDTTTLATLGVRYAPTRTILLGCDVSRESRSVSVPDTAVTLAPPLSYPYKANAYGCSGQIVLK